jgi:hypothetical protein
MPDERLGQNGNVSVSRHLGSAQGAADSEIKLTEQDYNAAREGWM